MGELTVIASICMYETDSKCAGIYLQCDWSDREFLAVDSASGRHNPDNTAIVGPWSVSYQCLPDCQQARASPWIEAEPVYRATADPGDKDSVPLDHTSILAMLLGWPGIDRSALPCDSLKAAPTFDDILRSTKPRTDSPAP